MWVDAENLTAQFRTLRAFAKTLLATTTLCTALAGCETDEPCARREAACADVVLWGLKDDGMGRAIAYKGLSLSVYAPNQAGPQRAATDGCEIAMVDGKPVKRPYGSMTSLGSAPLQQVPVPTLTLKESFSPSIQGRLTVQLPATFNELNDRDLDDELGLISDTAAQVSKLQELRDQDPRAIRVILTQEGLSRSVWDSRCDEALFSSDEWRMKKYYRIGKNRHIGVFASLEGAMTSSP